MDFDSWFSLLWVAVLFLASTSITNVQQARDVGICHNQLFDTQRMVLNYEGLLEKLAENGTVKRIYRVGD